jgi:hypothetical protein
MDDPNQITYFAETDARHKKIKFGIKAKDRLKHVYVIGKTGMGKSTFLENMAIQDIQNGNGLTLIDPHGGTAEKLLDYVPESRIKDVLYFAPFDLEHPVSFNVMEDVGPDRRHLVVNGLMSTFEKIWADAWSARMAYILQYSILALLEYPGSTLLGINRMLSDKEYRKKVVDNVKDASVKSFWIDEFGKYTERFAAEATPAIQNKVGQFTSNPLVRNIIGQPKSSFDIRKMMDEKKILIINLSKGRVGEGNANLLGSMLITKIYLAAMSRADLSESEINKLPNFYLYVDEFQSFANKSFADILSEARKYKLNLTIAHQYIEQMEEEVRNAVFGNVGTMVTFRVGAFDAEVLEKEFAPVFTAEDLVNLGFTQIYLKLMIDGVSSAPFSATTMAPIPKQSISFKEQIIESSRKIYSRERKDVENEISNFYQEMKTSPTAVNSSRQDFPRRNEERKPPVLEQKPIDNNIVSLPSIKTDLSGKQPPASNNDSFTLDKNKQAFLDAQKELLKKQSQTENVVTINNTSTIKDDSKSDIKIEAKQIVQQKKPVEIVEPISQKTISLNELKKDNGGGVQPNRNLSSLKDALSSVLNKQDQERPKVSGVSNTTPVSKQIPVSILPEPESLKSKDEVAVANNVEVKNIEEPTVGFPKNEKKDDKKEDVAYDFPKKFVKEVPEDVLRNLLKMD